MPFRPLSRASIAAVLTVTALTLGAPAPVRAQSAGLPSGKLDSATVNSMLQTADFVFVDDRARGAALFGELWRRRADVPPAMHPNIAYSAAVASGDQEALVATFRDLARSRPGNEFKIGLMRVLLITGEYTESLDSARAYQPAANEPPRPIREEMEANVAQLRGNGPAMLTAARAMRRYPGWDRNYVGYTLHIGALAMTNGTAALPALLDSALTNMPRGFRVDPVVIFSNYGNLLAQHGHTALARRAWTRALAVLDSTRAQAEARGAVGLDSVRISRGRLMLALERYTEARELLEAPSRRLDPRERLRLAWLAVAHTRSGDTASARRLDRALASDTVSVLRGPTATARAMIAEALGEPRRGADLLLASRRYIDLRGLPNNYHLQRTVEDPRIVAWLRGR